MTPPVLHMIIPSTSKLPSIAHRLLQEAGDKKVWLFFGEMGVGKTTLIKALCEELGVKDTTSSPTFSIVNEYEGAEGPIYHFDFYRIRSEQEAWDLGYEEYFYSGQYCFVEWPELIPSLLPEDAAIIRIELSSTKERHLTLEI